MMDGWERLWKGFERRYFAEPLLQLVELAAIVIGLILVRNQKMGRLFIFYIAFDFSISIIDTYLLRFANIGKFRANVFIHQTNIIISFIELGVYNYFLRLLITSEKAKRFFKTSLIFYFILTLGFLLLENFTHLKLNSVLLEYYFSILGFIFLIGYSMVFFKQLLNSESSYPLLQRPSFWIITGIFFYSFISTPYYLIGKYLHESRYEYRYLIDALLFYFPFTVNFVFLIKAFLCKKLLTI